MFEIERSGVIEEACGVVAALGVPEASKVASLALHALQHRGQESVGLSSVRDGRLVSVRRMGKVGDAVSPADLASLAGQFAIGHVRYATAGGNTLENAQPVTVELRFGTVAIAHNGNLTNASMIRRDLESRGSIFHTDVDTEVIAHLIARSDATTLEEAIASALPHLEGAYSLVILSQEAAFAIRDAFGVRPLSIGRIGDGHVIASETCALDLVRASHERDVKPGEMVVFEFGKPPRSRFPLEPKPSQNCVFELIYFARPDSRVFGRGVYNARFRMGERLAAEAGAEADIVIPVPDSGVPAALGFAKGAAVEYGLGLIRSHYVGRTFIEPSGSIRDLGVKLKLNPVRELIEGRRVVVVDDSIVRGTTCKKIVKLLRESGAREVHFRVASPATLWPCFYGIDTPDRTQLIAANHSVDEIREFIGADSLGYLSLDGLRLSVGSDGTSFCEACLTGHYAAGVIPERDRRSAR